MALASGYDPFARGPLPVGVRTLQLIDDSRQRREIPTEVWYPTTDAYTGRDVDRDRCDQYVLMPGLVPSLQLAVRDAPVRDGSYPLVVFSHGYGSHRRQSTFFCTHLASHGYIVAAPDHTGNTAAELISDAMHGLAGQPRPATPMAELLLDRPPDISFIIDDITERFASVDHTRVGVTGHSFGGWTTLAVTGRDDRVRAAVPLAPAGGVVTTAGDRVMLDALRLDWDRDVPTLFIVAELDSLLPLPSMRRLYDPLSSPKQLIVINQADHMHFCDDAERIHDLFRLLPPAPGIPRGQFPPFAELCPAAHGYDTVRGLGLAHMDAHLAGRDEARSFLSGRWRDGLTERGVDFDTW